MANRIQVRRDTAANWTSENPILAAGEPAYETDTAKEKIGDGSTVWTSLPYIAASTGTLDSVIGGTDITVDNTDPINPIVNFTGTSGGGQVDSITAGAGIQVTGTATVPIVTADMTLQEVLDSAVANGIVTDGTDISEIFIVPNGISLDNIEGTTNTYVKFDISDGQFRVDQHAIGVGSGKKTILNFNNPIASGNTTVKVPANTTDGIYNLAVQVTDGVTTVDADTEGILDISTLAIGGGTLAYQTAITTNTTTTYAITTDTTTTAATTT